MSSHQQDQGNEDLQLTGKKNVYAPILINLIFKDDSSEDGSAAAFQAYISSTMLFQ